MSIQTSRFYASIKILLLVMSIIIASCGGGKSDTVETDTTPDMFSFIEQIGVLINTLVLSNSITISGIDSVAEISISGGEYSIDNGLFTADPGTISSGQSVVVELMSASGFQQSTTATLTVGGVSGDFSVTTISADTTPDAFNFSDQINVSHNIPITSNAITISGINTDSPVSIIGGEYAIDGNTFTANAGNITDGQTVAVRVMSASGFQVSSSSTLTIGGISDEFVVTTVADTTAPSAVILFPPAVSSTDSAAVIVTGTASDDGTVSVVRVNGVDATSSDGFANWQATVPLNAGANALTVEVSDNALNNNTNADSVAISFNGTPLLIPFDIEIDAANNRALIIEAPLFGGSKGIASVDLTGGTRTTFSDATTPDTVNPFNFPGDVSADSDNNRVFVTDFQDQAIYLLDSNGGRTIFSDNTTPDGINPFSSPFGLVLDSARNRLLVSDLSNIIAVDLTTGSRTILASTLTMSSGDIALDNANANNRLLVLDSITDNFQVVAIDLTTGVETLLSDDATPNALNPLEDPRGIDVDTANNRALVTNKTNNSVIAVDLTTGERSLLSDNTTPDTSTPFSDLSGGIGIDSANNRALVVDNGAASVIAVDLTSGVRSQLTSTSTPDSINPFSKPFDIAFDSAGQRLLVVDSQSDAIIIVNSTNGARSILSDGTTPDTDNVFGVPVNLAIDANRDRILVLDEGLSSVIAVDLATGSRTIFSDATTPDANNPFTSPNSGIVIDSANTRALVADSNEIIAVDLTSGIRTILSNNATPDVNNPFSSPTGIAVDTASNRLLVVDGTNLSVIAVDLSTGARVILSDATTPDSSNAFVTPSSINVDTINNRALVTDSGMNAIIAVNLDSGVRTILSDDATPDAANSLSGSLRGLTLDDRNNLQAVDFSINAIIAIDQNTGERVLLSK